MSDTNPSDVYGISFSDISILKNYIGLHFFGKGDINVVSQDSFFWFMLVNAIVSWGGTLNYTQVLGYKVKTLSKEPRVPR